MSDTNTPPLIDRRELIGAAAAGVVLLQAPLGARAPAVSPPPVPSGRETLSLDGGWRFHAGDIFFPPLLDHEAAYSNAKAGNASGAAAADYNDSAWAEVTLPHDYALTQPYDRGANPDEGYRARGIGWYRRLFLLAEADRGRHLELRFDGAATFATVWINGTVVHRNFSGFTGFSIDLTPFALFGEDVNAIAIRVDATQSEGWWYEGAGLYRHAWLIKRPAVHIATDGVHAHPQHDADGWHVPVEVDLDSSGRGAVTVEVVATLISPIGQHIDEARRSCTVEALGTASASLRLAVGDPQLWSPDMPTLHTIRVALLDQGRISDVVDTRVGFRTLRFDAASGFLLNGRPLKIKGACMHGDHAGVGVAVPDSLWDFRLRRLKQMGANALRCAHNPPAPELLDAADRLGLMVLAETRTFNASEDYLPQLAWMVRRDRNHPSIILWSLANEESLQSSEQGVEMVRRMKAVVRSLDRDRPVTAAMNGGMFATVNIGQELDIVGFNYCSADYDRFHAEHPDRPMISTEDGSAYMTRGEFTTDPARHVLASYDEEHASFGATFRHGWRMLAERPYMAGGFVWTGFDYRGEPSPFDWPNASSSFGAMDLCGFPKTAFHIRRALWIEHEPVLELAPHWTWPGREGQPIKVMAITNAERVRLTLNGREVADLAIDPFEMASCIVPYAPGRLVATAFRGGKAVARAVVETTGSPARVRLTPDRPVILGDGRDAMPITVEMLDARDRPIPTADARIAFEVDGGTIIGMGNGDARSHEPDQPGPDGAHRRLYNGLAQVIVFADPQATTLRLVARAEGVRAAILTIPVAARPAIPSVAPQPYVQRLTEWRTSPPDAARPDPREKVQDGDMNSWGWLKPGSTQAPFGSGRFYRFQVDFTPSPAIQRGGGHLLFGRLAGRAEIWLDGRLAGRKDDADIGRVSVALPPRGGARTVTVLFDAPVGSPPFGIAGSVTVSGST